MRTHIYMVALTLCAVSAAPSRARSQSQQENAQQAASAKQIGDASGAQQTAATGAGATKTAARQSVVFTNENLKGQAANQAVRPETEASSTQEQKAAAAQDPKTAAQPAKPGGAAANPQTAANKPTTAPKVQIDAHKVLTNEDLEKLNKHRGMSVVGIDVDLNAIYDCDINCYNYVRSSARIYSPGNLDWMRDLRSGIEDLQKDNNWRAELVNLVHLRSKYCTLAADENEELQKADNFQNVTDQQIDIRERYNAKLSDANQAVTTEYERTTAMEATYPALVRRFMEMQVLRIMQSVCVNQNPYRPNYYPSDDPE